MYSCLFQANNSSSFEQIFKENKVDYSCFDKQDQYGTVFKLDEENIEKQMDALIELRRKADKSDNDRWEVAIYLNRLNDTESYNKFIGSISFDGGWYGRDTYFKSELAKKDFLSVIKSVFNTIMTNVEFPDNVKIEFNITANKYTKWFLNSKVTLYDDITSIRLELPFILMDLDDDHPKCQYEYKYSAQRIRREIKQYLQDIK